ncbi:class I SAM-dependent methyltransferase [Jidongwangia harbinensis]|uniref:class I SAM-dependent methyltransferase n=1 Tax=Jidongwangia harbinensis TaxID=2878561 RepID=UPI001CD9E807|nr:class I SAM-dependent methyltransferase [Jidongwangia harbinensis]MCA2211953.1 class I SAM-dependent methyltransferase [Jidongwangia harbinensis]
MTGEFSSTWLALREPADAAARATALVDTLRADLRPPLVIRDLGCGTGSLGRWLAPRLPGPQHWILHDHDPALLAHAAAHLPRRADHPADSGAAAGEVTVETRQGDVTALTAADLAGTSLVTCSALLDLFTAEEIDALADACAKARCAALFTLSVAGQVTFEPADPRDGEVAAAFNDHQRRRVGERRLLGPDAGDAAAAAFAARGATVTVAPTPWRLGSDNVELIGEWLRGWLSAAAEERPDLGIGDYARDRIAAADAGRLRATVAHVDLLARFD